MWHCSNAHHRPSLIIESTTSPLPMRRPSRTRGSRYGQLLIDSMPPATAMSMSPARDALVGEHHRLQARAADLVDRERGDVIGQAAVERRLPRRVLAEARATTTLPMMHSSTIAGSMPARRTASATTSAPSSGAVKPLSAPRNLPVGVRTALTMTDFTHGDSLECSTSTDTSVRRAASAGALRMTSATSASTSRDHCSARRLRR